MAARIRKGDTVVVMSGKDKGKTGKVMRVLLEDAALGGRGAAALLQVPLHDLDLLDADAALLVEDLEHLAGLALVLAADDDDVVALANARGHHSTSGASEMIFMNFLARSSRATGPKMRVPIGSRSLLMSTALFSSKRM